MAILIVAIAATIAAGLLWQQSMTLRQVENLAARGQGREIARAAAAWAAVILADDDATVDHLKEPWATVLPPIDVGEATVSGSLSDATARFNLNNLVADGKPVAAQVDAFRAALAQLGLEASLADALVDWIDPDSEPVAGGAESNYYLTLEPPYNAANRPLTDLGELRLVRGFTDAVVAQLAPLVTVLPGSSPINVNTTTAEVLAIFMPEVNAQTVTRNREQRPFLKTQDFLDLAPEEARSRLAPLIAINSSYFSARALVRNGRARIAWHAILARSSGQATGTQPAGWPRVITFHEEPL
jgi:general secretion pathway protein K